MQPRVHIAGLGVISAIGASPDECFHAFEKEQHGIGSLQLLDSIYKGSLPVGEVKLTNESLANSLGVARPVTRTALLGMHAARQAVQNARVDLTQWRVGLISATTVGGMDRSEIFFTDFYKDNSKGNLHDIVHHGCGATTELIADHLNIKDYVTTINTACSSSLNSIMLGTRLIRHDHLDVVVAGGADALTKFTINGFKSLMILDDQLCRPFDANRRGLNLGEGAGFVVLVSERVLSKEKLSPLASVSGYANTNDAFHQTASSPDGRGSYNAMEQALALAQLNASDIGYINLHGTGTVNNDLSEGVSIKRLFGDYVPAISSTKTFTGHTLGACGGIEAVFSVLALEHQALLPNLRFEQAMPELDIQPVTQFRREAFSHVMSNSFGFGGNCSSIIFSKPS